MGRCRCWIIRGLILVALTTGALAAWVAHGWVSPESVRVALIAALQERFPDTDVQVGSARLRLFGGISVTDVRLTRRGESEPFAEIPAAIIYHDKEQLSRGQLVIRKVELDGPTIRLIRYSDTTWNITGLTKPSPPDTSVPTFVVRNATVLVSDRRPEGLPPVGLLGARLSLLNDPVSLLKIEAQFTLAPGATGPTPLEGGLTIPVGVSAKVNRATEAVHARFEIAELAVGPRLVPILARLHPELGEYAAQFSARVGVKADLTAEPARPLRYDVQLDVQDGRWDGEELPWPVEQLTAAVRVHDGQVTVSKGTARLGKAPLTFSLETRPSPETPTPAPGHGPRLVGTRYSTLRTLTPTPDATPHTKADILCALENRLERFELTVRELLLDDDLFGRLSGKVARIANRVRAMFQPVGKADLTWKFTRTGAQWERVFEFRPTQLVMAYEKYPYPIQNLSGWVRKVVTSEGTDEFRVQLTGTAGGRRIEATGRVAGEGPDPLIDLKIAGTDVPIDEQAIAPLPPPYPEALRKLRCKARGDVVVEIRQPYGVNRSETTIRVRMYDGSVNYTHFPYPLTQVRGHVRVFVVGVEPRPGEPIPPEEDRVELRDFEGVHAGGRLWIPSGGSEPIPGTKDRRLTLELLGADCPIDADLKAAMTALKLDGAWRTFAPRGRIRFGARVEVLDRAAPPFTAVAALPGEPPFDPVADLKLTVNFEGPTVTPTFFPYELDDLAGVVRYQGGKVDLAAFRARHGPSRIELNAAEVRFGDGDEIWANLGGLTVRPLLLDAALAQALPESLRSGLEELKLRGPMELNVKHLVVQVPPGSAPGPNPAPPAQIARGQVAPTPASPALDPTIYWNAELKLAGAALDTGLEWADVHGTLASVGVYEGTHLGAVLGNAWLDQAVIARQPIRSAKATFRIRPQEPDPSQPGTYLPAALEFPDLTASLYQGTVGGEARVILADPIRYRLWLTASGIHLDELARHCRLGDGAELRGLAQGKLLIENRPDPQTGLLVATGAGQIDVPNGRMYNLPVLLPLLKLLKLQAPDQTAFEEAHATFELKGDRITVSQLDLIGTAVSLGGSGELNTDGKEVRFEFYTIWSQALKRWLTTPFGDVTSLLSGSLFQIEMVKQKNGPMEYHPHMLPVVTEPVRAVAERLRNRMGRPGELAPPGTFRALGPR